MTRPVKLPLWATGSGAAVVEPSESQKSSGWVPFQVPPAEYFNYEMNLVGQWHEYLSGSELAMSSTLLATSGALGTFDGTGVLAAGSDTRNTLTSRFANVHYANDFSTFAAAVAAANASGKTLMISTPQTITTAIGTITAPVEMVSTGQLVVNTGGSVTLTGPFSSPLRQVFDTSGGGVLTFSSPASAILPQWWGALGNGTHDDTAAVNSAIAAAAALTKGGLVYLGPGSYPVSSVDMSNSSPSQFYSQVRLVGAGRFVTRIMSRATGNVLVNMAGRNHSSIECLSIDSGPFLSQAGIWITRTTSSGNANNNLFRDVWVYGAFSKASVVSLGAESTSWSGCRLENSHDIANHTAFFTSTRNDEINVSVAGVTPLEGPNTDNTMTDCEFYSPYVGARIVKFSRTAAYRMVGCSVIGGSQSDQRLVTYSTDGAVPFNGPIEWFSPHFEHYGTNNVIHYFDTPGNASFEVSSYGGYYNVGNNTSITDYDRTDVNVQPKLYGSTWTPFKQGVGFSGYKFYMYVIGQSTVTLASAQSLAEPTLVIPGFLGNSVVHSTSILTPLVTGGDLRYYQSSVVAPVVGTFARGARIINNSSTAGGVTGWECTVGGTQGTLAGVTGSISSGSNVLTVNTATGLVEGQLIAIAGVSGAKVIVKISGTTVYLVSTSNATVVAAAVTYSPATLIELPRLEPVLTTTGTVPSFSAAGGLVAFGQAGTGWAGIKAYSDAAGTEKLLALNPAGTSGVIVGGTVSAHKISKSLRATATLDTNLIATLTTVTQDIALTGATVGAEVSIGGPATLEAGLLLYAYVSATNTVTLRVFNGTAAGVTPAAAQTVSVRSFNP